MTSEAVDEHVLASLIKTHGNLYRGARLTRYPIPRFPLPEGAGRTLLDIGCNWGRWTIAASRAGWRTTGIDRAKKSVGAACRVAEQLGVDAEYVVGDARELPFGEGSFDAVFSYSVLQHLSKEDVREGRRGDPPGPAAGWNRLDRDAQRARAAQPRSPGATRLCGGDRPGRAVLDARPAARDVRQRSAR